MKEPPTNSHPTAVVTQSDRQDGDGSLVRTTAAIIDGPDLGLAFPLLEHPIVIGTSRECDIVLTDRAVSKKHVELRMDGGAVRVRDLESTNGTFIGKARVLESVVPPGAVVKVGRTRLHLRSEESSLVLNPSTSEHFGELWGKSVAMRQVFAVLERVSGRDVNILFDGETGTGKELAARAVHQNSGRASGPMIVLDCSAVAPELVESQLFGHRRGAFTGAMQDRAGVFETASGGTLFLDELDSLPLDLQPKLLRVLENRQVVRLGEFEPRPVDVRLVAACGRSPEEGVGRQELRRDLYFRLAVVRVTLPALKDRLEDLPLLAEKLLHEIGNNEIEITDGPNLARMRQHPWMGNVRELRNVLERALLLAPPGSKTLDDLPLRLSHILRREQDASALSGVSELMNRLPYKEAKDLALNSFEQQYLKAALARNGANLSRTARDVGLTRHHLRKLLRGHRLIAERGPGRPPGKTLPKGSKTDDAE
ncbi:MAG: sigma 54-interacting transcriptional regulator [Myxococcota bacterium]|nr:sigma 54-interacting transcriptional regulator [Myxococcota bacterium]